MNTTKAALLLGLLTFALASDCGPGGVLCPSGTCHFPAYIEGCYIYQSSSSCNQCEYNYIKSGNLCTYSPPLDTSDCCLSFAPTGECQECAPGLVAQDGTCKDLKIVGCLVKSNTGSCLNCAIEYELYGGQCFKKIAGCSKYASTGLCTKCSDKYSLERGLCVPLVIYDEGCHYPFILSPDGTCSIPGCSSTFDYGCADCIDGFSLLPDGSCQKGVIEGCQLYSSKGGCVRCKTPVFTLYNDICLSIGCVEPASNGKCGKCNSRYGFQLTSDGYCKIRNCVVSSNKECLVCEAGYIESQGGCIFNQPTKVCTVCANNYYLGDDGVCHPQQPGCIKYLNGKCQECKDDLYLTSTYSCQPKEPGCIYERGICQSCRAPFRLNKKFQCIIEGCSLVNFNGCQECSSPYVITPSKGCTFQNCYDVFEGRCVKCFDGYGIRDDGKCYKLDPHCNQYSFQGTCMKCVPGFYLNTQGKCQEENLGCNYIDGRCASCRAPFEYNPKDESCQIDGCLTYFIGGCKSCDTGYDLRYNTCKLPNCLISYKGHCKECDPDYIMRSDGRCVNKDEFCWKYDSNGFCTECAPKYFLSKLTNKCKLREPGCLYNDNDKCSSCEKPFFFDGVRCEIYGCLELDYDGCKQCFYPMEVTGNKLCSVVNCDRMEGDRCAICKPGFFIAKDGSCKREDPKCQKYGVSYCEKCVKGYRLDERGICQYADEHCWDFSAAGSCTNCDRLYFLNGHNKCEIKDSNCQAYCGGRCIDCKNHFYLHRGLCYPNAKGCEKQKNIKKCEQCESGYKLEFGVCTPELTKLSWNSIDMDFWSGDSDAIVEESQTIFSEGKTNKLNLDPAIYKGKAQIVYSSCKGDKHSFQVDDNSVPEGWTCNSQKPTGQYIGIVLDHLETFYAFDLKVLKGSSLKSFSLEYSEDGFNFKKVRDFEVSDKNIEGVVETYYFTPVFAKAMRLVVIQGVPSFKFEFYYSNGENKYAVERNTYISETTEEIIDDNIRGEIFHTQDSCIDKELCWMGLEVCEPREIKGFALEPKPDSKGEITSVVIKYSRDGVSFSCYANCSEVPLKKSGAYVLDPTVVATKLRVYPAKWVGNPTYSVTFNY